MIDLEVCIDTRSGECDEVYTEWFECPNCECQSVMEDYNYCPICGASIVWCEAIPEVIKPEARSDKDA